MGCRYLSPLLGFNELLADTLQSCDVNNNYVFIFGDFNIDASHNVQQALKLKILKTFFSLRHISQLINVRLKNYKSCN